MSERRRRRGSATAGAAVALLGWAATACEPPPPPPEYIEFGREVDQNALRGLVTLRDALGEQFRSGFFLNTGTEAYRIDDRIYVCPIDRLWQTNRATTTSPT